MRSSIRFKYSRGFTMIEAVMVIVIIGIIGSVLAMFIRGPVQGYFDSVRRAELTDTADVAMRRMARDVRLSLPNSLRVTTAAGVNYIEFIMTSAGGRYRNATDGSTNGNFLSFTDPAVVTFDVLGAMPSNPTMNADDYIVIYNLGEGYEPANAYAAEGCTQCNRAKIKSIPPGGNVVTLFSNPFTGQAPPLAPLPPLPSPSARFQVVPGGVRAVTFACPTVTAGNLSRHANYGFNAVQATPPAGAPSLLADGVTCAVEYTNNATGRSGLLSIDLTLWNAARTESVTLFQQIHVDNSP